MVRLIKKGFRYLNNHEIDIRLRMLFFLEYAAFFACIIGTIAMLGFTTSITVLIPNFILIIFCGCGIFLSHVKKKYDLAAIIIVVGCTYIALPYMYFTAGGFRSGMPIWFIFGVIFTCMMMRGKLRIIMPAINICVSSACILIDYYNPGLVIPLADDQAVFMDMLQSFVLVTVMVCISLMIYLASYDRQRLVLEQQRNELKLAMNTDSLTGIYNRRAYYDDTSTYANETAENLVLVAMDVNGLKSVNDTQGHAAGDELLKQASEIMTDAYSRFGKIYRTGGDEFVAILFCENQDAEELDNILKTVTKAFNEKNDRNISIAQGMAVWNLNQEKNFFELEKLADSCMYQNKSAYYRDLGRDRRKR